MEMRSVGTPAAAAAAAAAGGGGGAAAAAAGVGGSDTSRFNGIDPGAATSSSSQSISPGHPPVVLSPPVAIALPESSGDESDYDQEQQQEQQELNDQLDAYSKDYEAVLRIREQLESSKKNLFHRQATCPHFSLDCLLASKQREYKILVFVLFLLVVIVAGLVTVYSFYEENPYYVYRGRDVMVNEKTMNIEFYGKNGELAFRGRMYRTSPAGKLPFDCTEKKSSSDGESSGDEETGKSELCLLWKNVHLLNITDYSVNNITCHDIQWTQIDETAVAMDCYKLDGAHLYGGGLLSGKQWPLDGSTTINRRPFVSGTLHEPGSLGTVLERYWLTSHGVGIFVADNSPLYISLNEEATRDEFCLIADYNHLPMHSINRINSTFKYTVCISDEPLVTQATMAPLFADRQTYTLLPSSIFTTCVWSTWGFFKRQLNQSGLVEYARQIQATGYSSRALLLVDDGWEERYGDIEFNSSRFHDPAGMMKDLHDAGFDVSMWFHIHLNTDSRSFQVAMQEDYMLSNTAGDVPGLVRWWNGPHEWIWSNGVAGLVDLINPRAVEWYHSRLKTFVETNKLDSAHFTEYVTVPLPTSFKQPFTDLNQYTQLSAQTASRLASSVSHVFIQSAYKSQRLPVVVRLTESTSRWNASGGLSSIVPSMLTLGLIGYPIVVPPPVGGPMLINARPSKELYIRWLQLTAFLPILHFSIPPHHYDEETVSVAKTMIHLHNTVLVPHLLAAINDSMASLSPVIRPVWWIRPRDEDSLLVSNQFLVGDRLLVCPVTLPGAKYRDIYIPSGRWRDQLTFEIHVGPMWMYNYALGLDQIPYFILL